MNKWYFLSDDDMAIIGPFTTKDRAMLYMGWVTSRREGDLYYYRHRYLGKKSSFLRCGYGHAFESYKQEVPKPSSVPGWKW